MIHEPLISVCIPAFNAEDTLARCASSVLEQKYESCEVIIVDDGSIDNTPNICSDLAANYENVTVFHQENRGQLAARNKAASKAKGQYILFLDSDDELEPNSLQLLSTAIEKTNADIIFFDCSHVDFAGNKILQPECFPGAMAEINQVSKNEVLVRFLTTISLSVMWIHIVKTHLAEVVLKDEKTHLRYGEDVIQNISLYYRAKTFAYVRASIYLHIQNSESISHKKNPEKLWMDWQEVGEAVHEFALKAPLDGEMRTEVERGMLIKDAMRIVVVVAQAHELPIVRAKKLLKSIRASVLFQGVRNKWGLKLPWSYRIVLMMLSEGEHFDSLLLFCGSLRDRLRSFKNPKPSKK